MITLTPTTNQEAYDLVKAHLTRPGARQAVKKRPEHDAPMCMYRTDDGNRCAAGAMIPDEQYKGSIEGISIEALVRDMHKVALHPGVSLSLIQRLQGVHDRSENWDHETGEFVGINQYGYSFAAIAADFDLDP